MPVGLKNVTLDKWPAGKQYWCVQSIGTYSFVRSPSSLCSAGASAGPRASRAFWSPPGSYPLRHSTSFYRSAPTQRSRVLRSASQALNNTTLIHCTASLLQSTEIIKIYYFLNSHGALRPCFGTYCNDANLARTELTQAHEVYR